MPASSKAISGCSHSSLLPLLPGLPVPSGCHRGCCQCQLLASSLATTWACRNPGSLRGTWACTVRAGQTFQSVLQKCTPVPGWATDNRSKYYRVAQLQNTRQGNTGSRKCTVPGREGKTQPCGSLKTRKCVGNIMEVAISQNTRAYLWL